MFAWKALEEAGVDILCTFERRMLDNELPNLALRRAVAVTLGSQEE